MNWQTVKPSYSVKVGVKKHGQWSYVFYNIQGNDLSPIYQYLSFAFADGASQFSISIER